MNAADSTSIPTNSLKESVEEAVRDGHLGAIVALRVLMSAGDRPVEQLSHWLDWGTKLFACENGKLFASQDPTGGQISLLLTLTTGATISLTAVRSSGRPNESTSTLQLLLMGQHGVARLQGGEDIDPSLNAADAPPQKWRDAIDRSLASGKAVDVA